MGRDFSPVQTGPGVHPATCTVGTGSFPGVKYGRSVLLTAHPLLVPWSRKSRAIPLPTLWTTTGPVTGTLYLLPPYNNAILKRKGSLVFPSFVGIQQRYTVNSAGNVNGEKKAREYVGSERHRDVKCSN